MRALGLVTFVCACGSSHTTSGSDAALITLDAGEPKTDASHDAGHRQDAADGSSISTTYPAFTVDMPTVVSNQDTILKSPVIVTVTWPSDDPSASTWEAMGDAIGTSSYWGATTGEYGVGNATSGSANHVHMTRSLPASISYYDVANLVTASLGSPVDGGSGSADAGASDAGVNPPWPAPTMLGGNAQTIYTLFIPASVNVLDPGSGVGLCAEGGLGYHDNVVLGSSTPIAYAVTLECAGQTAPDLEETAAHEFVEAATNPYPSTSSLGYKGFDADHLAWDVYTGFNDELADACQNWADSYYQESSSFPYWVQRSWSNKEAALGKDPCGPRPTAPYEGMTLFPAAESSISINLTSIGLSPMTTRGFSAKVGETVTFQVGFYSDASTGPWTIAYDFPATGMLFDMMGNPVANGAATVTIDKTSGQNGEKATVSVTPKTAGPLGFSVMAITWNPPVGAEAMFYLPHYLPVLISNE